MEMFLENLGRKANHPDRWYRFVNALKDAGTYAVVIILLVSFDQYEYSYSSVRK